ncbi:DUF6920 family protein [Bacillus marasmi]|uniref:DUF6920 family protein n=1 Tax=Bacillus marasmi TaxID=1926279 RepID=UPI0011CC630D|nr:DUF6544 family protein [Bacillus marasmi]
MRIFISIIMFMHGLIHFLGFMKAYNLLELPQLTLMISKPIGVFWLLSALLLLITSILVLFKKDWVWMPSSMVLISSQILILLSWNDAKFGTIPNIIILLFIIFSFSSWSFNAQINREISNLLSHGKMSRNNIITEQMLDQLPIAVQKWLKYIGLVGKESIQTAYFKQKGQMKLKPNQKEWAEASVEQYVITGKPGFLWKVNMKMNPLIVISGRDKYQDGIAKMTIKLGSMIPVVNTVDDYKTNQSTMQRYLMELPWYPSAALNPYISWEEIDKNSAKATMTYKGITGSAIYHFNDFGKLLKVSALRYKDSNENSEPVECIGEVKAYSSIDGIEIPTKMNIIWVLDDGLFNWYKLEIINAKYNSL